MTTTTTDTATEAVEKVRPLSATQTRALSKLVANDADQVRSEINEFAERQKAEATERLRAEWAERQGSASEWEDKARAAMSRFESTRRRLIREAEDAGVSLSMPGVERYGSSLTVKVKDLDRAIKREHATIERARDAALRNLRRHELTLERRVLEASISTEAHAILDALPSARDLMVTEAQAAPAIEAGS